MVKHGTKAVNIKVEVTLMVKSSTKAVNIKVEVTLNGEEWHQSS